MKVVRISGAAILVALALGALAPSTALALRNLPEAGKCNEVAVGTGAYKNNSCTTLATVSKPGNFEFKPLELAEDLEWGGATTEMKLVTTGHPTVSCKSGAVLGRFTGPKTTSVKVTFRECTNPIAQTCQTNATEAGVIEFVPLEGEFGFIKNEVVEGKIRVSVGLDLKPAGPITDLTTYVCGPTAETAAVEGSVIAKFKEIDKLTRATNLYYMGSRTAQSPESFQEGPKDTLSTTYAGPGGVTTAGTVLKGKEQGGTNSPVTTQFEYVMKAIEREG
jgi:hypothetical protein